jgi:hypothetical protein
MILDPSIRSLPLDPLQQRQRDEIKAKEEADKLEKERVERERAESTGDEISNADVGYESDVTLQEIPQIPPNTFWVNPKPSSPGLSAPTLIRPLAPSWASPSYKTPTAIPTLNHTSNPAVSSVALSGDLVAAADVSRAELKKDYVMRDIGGTGGVLTSSVNVSSDRNPFKELPFALKQSLKNSYGNYPLLDRDRADEIRRQDAKKAYLLHKKYGDKWPWDPVGHTRPPLGREAVRKLWRRAFIYARTIAALKTKPPKQETRAQLDKLLHIALQATRKKIYYEWDLVMKCFKLDVVKEKKRQRRLRMGMKQIKDLDLSPPSGDAVKISNVITLLRNDIVKCSYVETLKLFAHQLGPNMVDYLDSDDEPMLTEDAVCVILDYCDSIGINSVPLSKSIDPSINYELFYTHIYPSDSERELWDNELSEKIRIAREDLLKDERSRKLYEQQAEAIKSKAIKEINDCWDQTYFEVSMDMIPKIVETRMSDPVYSKSKNNVGWGVPLTNSHKKNLFYIFTAGQDDPETQTNTCRRRLSSHLAENGGLVTHIPITPVRESMINCIQYSRGLDGLKSKEACELILEYLATRTQAAFRGVKKRRVIKKAIKMWKDKEMACKNIYFTSWMKWALGLVAMRRYCKRPLREWRKHISYVLNKQHVYTVCFWPFYTWKKYALFKVLAWKKGKLLKRVYNVYCVKRIFGAFKRYVREEYRIKRIVFGMRMKLMRKMLLVIVSKWRRYSNRRSVIRINWNRKGYIMSSNKKLELVYRAINVWRYYVYCVKTMKIRISRYYKDYVLDENDRRRHVRERNEQAKAVSSVPRNHVEHTNVNDFYGIKEKGGNNDDSNDDDNNNNNNNNNKGKTKDGKERRKTRRVTKTVAKSNTNNNDKKEQKSLNSTSQTHAPPRILSRLDSSPAFVGTGVARRTSEQHDHDVIAGKLKTGIASYVSPIGDPFHGTRYGKNGSLEPRVPPFPTVEECKWFGDLAPDIIDITSGCYNRFVSKEEKQMKISYCIFHRSGTSALQLLYNNVVINKKDRYTVHRYKDRFVRHYFQAFKEACDDHRENSSDNSDVFGNDTLQITKNNSCDSLDESRRRFTAMQADGAITRDQLEFDRAARMEQMDKASDQRNNLSSYVENKEKQIEAWNDQQHLKDALNERKEAHMKVFMEHVREETGNSDLLAMNYVAEFQVHAARKLFEVAARIRDEAIKFYSVNVKWRYLRRIRLLCMFKKVSSLYARQKLRNWLRLCVRWREVEKGMYKYHDLKDKWRVFNAWLRHVEEAYSTRSPGMGKATLRAKKNLVLYDEFLLEQKLIGVAIPYQVMNVIYATSGEKEWRKKDITPLFKRWQYYSAFKASMRKVTQCAVQRFNVRTVRRIFGFWKTGKKMSETYERRRLNVPYIEGRYNTDLECLRARFISSYRGKMSIIIRRENAKKMREVKLDALRGPSFKKFIHGLRRSVQERIQLEERMLVEAFRMRGSLEYEDAFSVDLAGKGGTKKSANDLDSKLGSKISTKSKSVLDAGQNDAGASVAQESTASAPSIVALDAGTKKFKDKPLPAGYGIGEITVILRHGQGIVGLMSTAKAEGKERDMGKFGCISAGYQEVFTLRPEEQLLAIEVTYGSVIERIRFHTSGGRRSDWIGKRISPTPHTKKLTANSTDINGVLYPEDKYIVGFHGYYTRLRIVGLGIITRVVKKQYVFSYYWIGDGGEKELSHRAAITNGGEEEKKDGDGTEERSKSGTEFSYLVRMRRSDIESALERAENFARNLWTNRAVSQHWKLSVFSKFGIVSNMTAWLFEAAAFRLVQLPITDGQAERLIFQGEEIKQQGFRLVERALGLRERVDKDAVRERPWKVKGIISPKDRASEKEYQKKLVLGWKQADDWEKEGQDLQTKGEKTVGEGKSLMPAIENSAGVMKYYSNLIEVARREIQLENDFGAEYFASVIMGTGGGGARPGAKKKKGFPLDEGSMKAMLGSVRVAQERKAEQEMLYREATQGSGAGGASGMEATQGGSLTLTGANVDIMSSMGNGSQFEYGGTAGSSFFANNNTSGASGTRGLSVSMQVARLGASGKRALLPIPPDFVVGVVEKEAGQSMMRLEEEVLARGVRTGTVVVEKLPEIKVGKREQMKAIESEKRKDAAAVKHARRRAAGSGGGVGQRPQTSPMIGAGGLTKLSMPKLSSKYLEDAVAEKERELRELEKRQAMMQYYDDPYFDDEHYEEFEEQGEREQLRGWGDGASVDGLEQKSNAPTYILGADDWDPDEFNEPDWIESVPSFWARQMARADALRFMSDNERSEALNTRVLGMRSDLGMPLMTTNQELSGMPIVKRMKNQKKEEEEEEVKVKATMDDDEDDWVDPTDEF